MHPALLGGAGLPRSGLAALYDFRQDAGFPQRLPDRSGAGRHATLGTTPGPEGTDPAWTAQGLAFDGMDDTASLPVAGARPSGTVLLALRLNAPSGRLFALGSGATPNRLTAYTDTAWQVIVEYADAANAVRSTSPGTLAAGGLALLAARWGEGGIRVRLGSLDAFPFPNALPSPFSPTWFEVGNCTKALGLQRPASISAFYACLYDRDLSDRELARAARVIRGQLALRALALP